MLTFSARYPMVSDFPGVIAYSWLQRDCIVNLCVSIELPIALALRLTPRRSTTLQLLLASGTTGPQALRDNRYRLPRSATGKIPESSRTSRCDPAKPALPPEPRSPHWRSVFHPVHPTCVPVRAC